MISKKKFGTTVTAFGVAAGMLLSSAAPAHAEETAKTVQETQKEQADAPSTQSETENENAEKTIAPAEETEKPGEGNSQHRQMRLRFHGKIRKHQILLRIQLLARHRKIRLRVRRRSQRQVKHRHQLRAKRRNRL